MPGMAYWIGPGLGTPCRLITANRTLTTDKDPFIQWH